MRCFFISMGNNLLIRVGKRLTKMAKIKIQGEQPFQVDAHSFSVSPSNDNYYLEYSADGVNYTQYEEQVESGDTLIVNGVAYNQFIRLSGNNSEVTIIW